MTSCHNDDDDRFYSRPVLVHSNPTDGMQHELVCVLCHDIPMDLPVLSTTCEHAFCKSCISKALEYKKECPICRQQLTMNQMKPISGLLKRIWQQVQVKCPHCSSWTGNMGNYHAHHSKYCPVQRQRQQEEEEQKKNNCHHHHQQLVETNERIQKENVKLINLVARQQHELETAARTRIQLKQALVETQANFLALKRDIADMRRRNKQYILLRQEQQRQWRRRQQQQQQQSDEYQFGRNQVLELTQFICQDMQKKPTHVNANYIFDCVKECYDDMLRDWTDNPPNYHINVRTLIIVCCATNHWFTPQQMNRLHEWSKIQGWTGTFTGSSAT